jgi:AcrR family transcriptional regulator
LSETQANSPRDRIIASAGKLFGRSGVRAVSLDDVAEAAGVTKKTIYYHFKSKDDLIAEWLTVASSRTFAAMAGLDEPEQAILTVFSMLGPAMASPVFRGCPFTATAQELNDPENQGVIAARAHKTKRRDWFRDQLAQLGHRDPVAGAAQLSLIWDGALSSAVLLRDGAAGEAAIVLVKAVLADRQAGQTQM